MLLAHGQLLPGDNFTLIVQPCPGECFATGLVCGTPETPLGTALHLYGNGVGVEYQSNLWNPLLYITSMSSASCLVAVEPVGWSALKSLYK
jgi:hypothetical protein